MGSYDPFDWMDDRKKDPRAIQRGWTAFFLAVLIGLAAMGVAAWIDGAFGQERLTDPRPKGFYGVGHAEHHEHYSQLPRTKANYSCCSSKTDGECRPTQARFIPGPWSYNNYANKTVTQPHGRWQAMVDGEWKDVVDERVMDQAYLQSKGIDRWDEQAHVCAAKYSGSVYCLIPPDGGQ
jgi:hypothetical protein